MIEIPFWGAMLLLAAMYGFAYFVGRNETERKAREKLDGRSRRTGAGNRYASEDMVHPEWATKTGEAVKDGSRPGCSDDR